MTRVCSVLQCPIKSGCKGNRGVVQCPTKSGSQENRRVTFFEINSESENYHPVLNAVGAYLKQSKNPPKRIYICEFHFANECILRTDTEIMKDGSQVLVERKRPRLKKNSIPKIFPNQTQDGDRKALITVNKPKKLQSHLCIEHKDCNQKKTMDAGEQHRILPDKVDMEIPDNVQKEAQLRNDQQESKSTRNHPLGKLGMEITENLQNQPMNDQEQVSIGTGLFFYSVTEESPIGEKYTQKHLIEDWKEFIEDENVPSDWTLCNSSHGIVFMYFGDDPKSSSRMILVKEDMSVEIRHHGRLANSPVLEKLRNFQDFGKVLNTIN